MKKSFLSIVLLLGSVLIACKNDTKPNEQAHHPDSTARTDKPMNNLVSIVEIPVTDFSRAVKFYQTILNLTIEEVEMGGVQMGLFPGDSNAVNVALAKGSDYKPTTSGAIVYLNAGDDLQPVLDKIEKNGGKVIVPKTQISPEMGFFALFQDSEGNKLGLHSRK